MEIAFLICSVAAAILVLCAYRGIILSLFFEPTTVGEKYWPVLITVMLTSFVVGCVLSVA